VAAEDQVSPSGILRLRWILFGGEQVKVMAIVYLCMPILMGVFGFIFFVISAAIYNLLARWLGGFEFEVTEVP
jgi:hypothetical protein